MNKAQFKLEIEVPQGYRRVWQKMSETRKNRFREKVRKMLVVESYRVK